MYNIFQKLLKAVLNKDIGYNYDEDWLYNQIIIKKLKAAGKLRSPNIIAAFEAINKSWYMPSRDDSDTFIDVEYESITPDLSIHLFSPSLYATILENLDLQQGHSFLNVGSGTGYLNSICGCLIGYKGQNIGLEIDSKLIDFSLTLKNKLEVALKDKRWSSPEYKCLNIFDFKTNEKFDRIFVGASIKEYQRTFICRMLKPFGIAIVACDNQLQKIYNIGGDQYIIQYLQKVEFHEIEVLKNKSKMPVKKFDSMICINDEQKPLTVANYANFKNLSGLIYSCLCSFIFGLCLSNSFFFAFFFALFLSFFFKFGFEATSEFLIFRPIHLLISKIKNCLQSAFYSMNIYKIIELENFNIMFYSIFVILFSSFFLKGFLFLKLFGLIFGCFAFNFIQTQNIDFNFNQHPSPWFMLKLGFLSFKIQHLFGLGFGVLFGMYFASLLSNLGFLGSVFLGIPIAAIAGFIFGTLFIIFNYFSFLYGFFIAFSLLLSFGQAYVFKFIFSVLFFIIFGATFHISIDKLYKRMKNIVGELCQNYDPNIFVDNVNGFACFYSFPEEANIEIKCVVEKYRMKKESEKSRKLQEKEAANLKQKIEKEKSAQLEAEKEIKIATAEIEKQNQEMSEIIRQQKMSIAEKVQEAKILHKIENDNCYNFAFAGHTKTGKSSLINAIRGIRDKDDKAAKVGITETTQIIQKYQYHDKSDKSIATNFYDIPGSGTLSHDANQYYHEKGLCAFDCLFILIQETFCEEEINFAIEALKHNQKVAFIQSKCDILLTNKKKQKLIKEINQIAVNECLQELKQNHKTEIQKSNISQLKKIPCFYVSAINLYDLKNGIECDVHYNEKELLEFMMSEIKYSRNRVS